MAARQAPRQPVAEHAPDHGAKHAEDDLQAANLARDFGGEPASSTPQRVTEKVKSEIARWTKVIADAGIPRQ